MKAKQLNSWVDRGLINVKLLDRTLAYFQNQTSYLQYIKTLKRPVPKIESPGFPGTQWSEYYWKDQSVMLLMLETDFPDGKNPDFCASLFREEPGVWKLKMEQFKRFVSSSLVLSIVVTVTRLDGWRKGRMIRYQSTTGLARTAPTAESSCSTPRAT